MPVTGTRRWWSWPTASPSWPTRGATRSRRWPRPATACSRPTSAATAARRSRSADRRLRHPSTSPTTSSACSTTSAPSGRCSSATTGAPMVVWHAPLLHPDRFAGVAGLSVPPVPRPKVPPTQALRKVFGDNFFYILYFQEPGVADAELDARPGHARCAGCWAALTTTDEAAATADAGNPARKVRRPHSRAGRLPDWLSQDEFDHYVTRVHQHRFHRRPELVPQLRPQLGADRDDAWPRRSPCRRCSSAEPPTRCWPIHPRHRVARWSPATTAK